MKKLLLSLGIVCLIFTSSFATEWEYITTIDKDEKSTKLFDGATVWIDIENVYNEFVVDRNILEFWVKFILEKPKNNISFVLVHFVMQIPQKNCYTEKKEIICIQKKQAIKQLIVYNIEGIKISERIAKTKEEKEGELIVKDSYSDILFQSAFFCAKNSYMRPNYIPSLD